MSDTNAPRMSIGAKISPGRDDDLIAWWLNAPPGDRARTVKAAIRAYLASQGEQEQILASIHQGIQENSDRLSRLEKRLSQGAHISSPNGGDQTSLDAAEADSEAIRRLSDQELERRTANMVRTRW